MDIIFKCKFGSHLYGTNTKNSDMDFKGIFLPTYEQILLGNIPKTETQNTKVSSTSKNTKDDIDIEYYSLPYFLKMACKGETQAIDMLHVNTKNTVITSNIWEDLQRKRSLFYTKNLNALVGYCRQQAAKYGVKGSRLDAMSKVITFLSQVDLNTKLYEIWTFLPEHEHIFKDNSNKIKMYEVCGKKFQDTVKVSYILNCIEKAYKEYGHRAELAKKNEGVDFKAVSHAIRAAMQLCEIHETGDLKYPLKHADFLRKVKNGEYDFTTEVEPVLNLYMDLAETLSEQSNYPEKVNNEYWNKWLIEVYEDYIIQPKLNITIDKLNLSLE